MTSQIPDTVLQSLQSWSWMLATEWRGETPLRIHDRAFDRGGTPRWSPDFRRYITNKTDSDRNPDMRLRTTRAFRLLRKKAVREFEVSYRIVILGGGLINQATLGETAKWLNTRSAKGGHTDRYTNDDVLIILHSGLDKVSKWL